MDNIDKDCIVCYGTGFHIHAYMDGQPMWGGCVKCNPETEESRIDSSNTLFNSTDRQDYYWVGISNGGMKRELSHTDDIDKDTNLIQLTRSATIEIVGGIWSSSEAAETALKNFSEKPNWEYEDKTIIVLNHDCLNTLLKCNIFTHK